MTLLTVFPIMPSPSKPWLVQLQALMHIMKHHLNGFSNIVDVELRRTIVFCAMSSRLTDAVLHILMEDNRATLRLQELKAEMESWGWSAEHVDDALRSLAGNASRAAAASRLSAVWPTAR